MLPVDELFSDGKLVPLQLSLVKCERAHPPKNCIAHPPKNHRPIVNPSARLDQVQGDGMAALSSLSLPLLHLGFVAGLGFLGGGFCWLCLLGVGHGVCSKFVGSWVDFCWVVVLIQVRVAVVSGFDLGLVHGLLRGLVLHLWFGLWFIGGFGHCDCPWVYGLLQTWWLVGCSKFEIFLFGLVVLYFWIDLILWGFRIWWYWWVWENGDFEIFNFWILIFGFVFLDLGLSCCWRHTLILIHVVFSF